MHRFATCSSEQPEEYVQVSQPEITVITGRMYSWQPGQMWCQSPQKELRQLDGPAQAHNSLYSTKTCSFLKQGSLPSARAISRSHS